MAGCPETVPEAGIDGWALGFQHMPSNTDIPERPHFFTG